MLWKRAEVAPIPWQAAESIQAVSSEDYVCSYQYHKLFSSTASTKGSEEVTYSNNVAESIQMFQGRKTIKSHLSDQVLFIEKVRRVGELQSFPNISQMESSQRGGFGAVLYQQWAREAIVSGTVVSVICCQAGYNSSLLVEAGP